MGRTLISLGMILLLSACAGGGHRGASESGAAISPEYTYNRLLLMDLDQMNALVKKHVAESKAGSDKVGPLKSALKIVLSRPDEDGMVDKVIGTLRNELDENEAWENSFADLTEEAVVALQSPENFTSSEQVTYAVFLENVVSQMKPRAHEAGFEQDTLKRIRDARIELTSKARSERSLKTMKSKPSPSEMANQVLRSSAAQNKKNRSKTIEVE